MTVAIVGAGPVGLFLAAELGVRGIATLVLGDSASTSTHPKANTHAARTMEIYRRHGISAKLRATSPSQLATTDVAYYTRWLGHELHRVPLPAPAASIAETREPATRWPTPEPQFRSSQLALEPLLLERTRELPSVEVRFGHRVVALDDGGSEVALTVETPGGGSQQIAADYVVGCDGGRSFVRRAMGTRLAGEGGLELDFMGGKMVATYFHAPGLQQRRRHPHAWQNWFILPHLRALLLTLDVDRDRYLLHYQYPPGDRPAKPFAEVLEEVVGAAVEAEVLSSAEWRAGVGLVAQRFRSGRCFLAGDAAHLFTPTGGFGLNTGIDDAFNLGWKLAAVHHGWAADALLDTYEAERRPAAQRNTAYALELARRNGECPVGAEIESDTPAGVDARAAATRHLNQFARWEYDTPGIQLGIHYRDSQAVVADGAPAPPDSPIAYVPNACAGSRLPHVWLHDGSSLYDALGPEYTLLVLATAADDVEWRDAAAARHIPLTIVRHANNAELHAIAGVDLLLVRPDQHIAWRGNDGDPAAVFDAITARVLARALDPA